MEWSENSGKALEYHYIFKLHDRLSKSFKILLDARTLDCICNNSGDLPEWTKLEYNKCSNCPLNPKNVEYCPVAVNIAQLVDEFRDFSSYESAYVLVMTKERDISKNTTVQEGLSSIMGVYMVTSGCPIMARLKPLVRFHLPFATINENVYRTVSMYLFAQYSRMKKGKKPDWELVGLSGIYEAIRRVNAGMSKRLKEASNKDASITAIASLDNLASLLPLIIDETINEIDDSISSYLQ